MTLNEVLARIDTICPNRIEAEIKVSFINDLEAIIVSDIYSRYPDLKKDGIKPYSIEEDGGKTLLAERPYDNLYVYKTVAEIHLILHEQKHYNTEIERFNALLEEYKVHLNKKHRPGGVSKFRVR